MFSLPDLPYRYNALEPVISERTLHFHHDKHHATYVKTLNELLDKNGKTPATLEEVIREASKAGDKKLFNNAAQAWNHSIFWVAMSAEREQPTGDLDTAIKASFGDLAKLKVSFVAEGTGHFGSGWVWLVANKSGVLKIRSTHDADDTLTQEGLTPLLVCDLWEHAYYLDHQNDRKAFLEAWFDALPNWSFAGSQMEAAMGKGQPWYHPAPTTDADLKLASAGNTVVAKGDEAKNTRMVEEAEIIEAELATLREREQDRAGVGEASHMGGAGTQSGQTDFANP